VTSDRDHLAAGFRAHRRSLTGYVSRLVLREDVAEEIVQQTAVRALEQSAIPEDPGALRAWLFRVATNLAVDHLRRHSTWRETVLDDARERAEASAPFVTESRLLAGSAEARTIAKDHLAVCFACTLRNLSPQEASALLLKEVYDFTVEEVAQVMDARSGQVKAWIQAARGALRERYGASCALVQQQGACFQCVELDRFFQAGAGDPLAGTAGDLEARLAIVRERREAPLGPWHRQLMRLVTAILEEPSPRPDRPGTAPGDQEPG